MWLSTDQGQAYGVVPEQITVALPTEARWDLFVVLQTRSQFHYHSMRSNNVNQAISGAVSSMPDSQTLSGGGGRLFEAGRLLSFLTFRVGVLFEAGRLFI